MFSHIPLYWTTFIMLLTVHRSLAETLSSTTDAVEVSTRATASPDTNSTSGDEPEWRSNDAQSNRQPAEKIVSIDASPLHKYRRDGIENLPENDHRRRYFLDFPERYQYENDLYRRDKNQQRYRGESYPVTVQGCMHPMRDVSRPQTDPPNRDILQGWLGGDGTGAGWRGSAGAGGGGGGGSNSGPVYHNDQRHNEYPLYVTTATPKIAPSYRNRDYAKYDYGYHDKNSVSYRPRYDAQTKISATRDYYDRRDREMERDTPSGWMLPPSPTHHRNRNNNRIVYYEYNLDDRLPRLRCRPADRNCGSANASPEQRWPANVAERPRPPDGVRFDGEHRFYASPSPSSSSSSSSSSPSPSSFDQQHHPREGGRPFGRAENVDDGRFSGYYEADDDEDAYRYRDGRRNDDGRQNVGVGGFGYVYSIDLPVHRVISPSSAYAYDMAFARTNQGYRHASMRHPDTR